MKAPQSDGFVIGTHRIGADAPVFVVAEISANHGGSLDVALRTIEAAAKAGADAIKLQTYTPDTLTLDSDSAPFIVRTKNEWAGRTLYSLYAEAMTPWEWHPRLRDAALENGLEWFSTPFDPTAVQFLEDLGAPAYKIASFEVVDLPLVETVAARGKPVIISTGMASLGEIEAALAAARSMGNSQIALLRCVSAYPADPAAMNLQSIDVLRRLCSVVGLSDHTRDSTAAICAVALGARVVEKHFILDRSLGGPDAFFSLEPAEFRHMVDSLRVAESAMGAPRFGPSPDEVPSVAFRRSLFLARDVEEGEILSCDAVRSVRPSMGLPAKFLPDVLGRKAVRPLRKATPLRLADVGDPPESPSITLRRATVEDSPMLLDWRNDEHTRAMSRNRSPVSAEEHARWLRSVLASGHLHLCIAMHGDTAVGQVRLDASDPVATEVSLTIAPEHRGRHLATTVLRASEVLARGLSIFRLTAFIRTENEASIRTFKAAGWYGFVGREVDGERMLFCERSLRRTEP
jgi:pseudaminic acid synthase